MTQLSREQASTRSVEAGAPDEIVEKLNDVFAGRYLIEGELGRGGMATVYLAQARYPARQIAIKVLAPTLTDALARKLFLREVDIASNLSHPHIVPIFAAGEVEETLYYVMPYIEGESLRVRLTRERPLPLRDAIHIMRDVAGALEYAHRSKVVHRDIKPGNILLTSDHALVTDFGIAGGLCAACGNDSAIAGLALGTPGYMSPEQAMGMIDADPRSDIYSLASMLYEMLHGELPSPDRGRGAQRAPTPTAQEPGHTIPEPVERALDQALTWDPAERFATVADFAQALASGYGPHAAS